MIHYLTSFTLVRTDTVTQAQIIHHSNLLVSEILAAEDALTLLQVRLEGANISLVDIIDDNGGNSNDFSRAGGHDCHQDKEEHSILSSGAEQLLGNKRSSQAFADILISQHWGALSRGETQVGQAHGGGQSEGDGKPDKTAADETPDTLKDVFIEL